MTPENSNYYVLNDMSKLLDVTLNYKADFLPQLRNSPTEISCESEIPQIHLEVSFHYKRNPLITRIFPIYFSITEYIHDLCEMQLAGVFSSANPWNNHNFNI